MPKKKGLIPEFYEMLVEKVIDKRRWDLPLVEKDTELNRVLSLLGSSDHVWVVDSLENKKLLGVITESDVLRALAPKRKITYFGMPGKEALHWEMHETAEHIMSRKPITCKLEEKVKDALDKMSTHRVRRLAVVDKNRIVEEVTLHYLIVIMRYYLTNHQAEERIP